VRTTTKKDFLRKNSNPRNQIDSKPTKKFQYYADKFKEQEDPREDRKEQGSTGKKTQRSTPSSLLNQRASSRKSEKSSPKT